VGGTVASVKDNVRRRCPLSKNQQYLISCHRVVWSYSFFAYNLASNQKFKPVRLRRHRRVDKPSNDGLETNEKGVPRVHHNDDSEA
jgi:hypothetical protein